MAKYTPSAIVSEMRNKIGGVVFSRSRAGLFVRRKVSPLQPRTAYQTAVRADFTQLAQRWSAVLTDPQRQGWISLAAAHPIKDVFSNTLVLTGLQMYIALNRALQTIEQTIIDDAPVTLQSESTGELTVVATVGTPNVLTVDPANYNTSVSGWVILGGGPMSPGAYYIGSALRVLKHGVTVLSAPTSFLTEYEARFGELAVGQRIPVGMVYINKTTGAMGIAATVTELVA